ncbi:hypothetical protein GMRT_14103 [Giardia muris]|uniref:CFA20 domain-containing protein n=1 Tax=Giardia muris TaxID=5742 RepID=A0A4Z1T0B0_GIAMU|nr:hypothetical protein GMRT_14103 [Giardia muris]|eukprot:TNJ30415.1 hypothetical protein GMRT_14103 [Giardia muris]
MYKQAFQGGPYILLLEAKGQNPTQTWNTKKASVTRVYNKEMKTYVLDVTGKIGSKITLPDVPEKQQLGITQPYLIFTLFILKDQPFSVNITILDHTRNRIRLYFSTANKTVKITPLHARLPLHAVAGTWSCLTFDLTEIIRTCFPSSEFSSISSLEVMPYCTLLRVLTAKACPLPTLELYCPSDEEDVRRNPRMPRPHFSLRQHEPLDKKVEPPASVHIQVFDAFYLSLFKEGKQNTDLAVRDQESLLDVRREFIPGFKSMPEPVEQKPKITKTVLSLPRPPTPEKQRMQYSLLNDNCADLDDYVDEDCEPQEDTYAVAMSAPKVANRVETVQPTRTVAAKKLVRKPSGTIPHGPPPSANRNAPGSKIPMPNFGSSNAPMEEVIIGKQSDQETGLVTSPQNGVAQDSDVPGLDLTLAAVPVVLKPERAGTHISPNRPTTPVLRNESLTNSLANSRDEEMAYSIINGAPSAPEVPIPLTNPGKDVVVTDHVSNKSESDTQEQEQSHENSESFSYYSDEESHVSSDARYAEGEGYEESSTGVYESGMYQSAAIPDPLDEEMDHPTAIPEPATNLGIAPCFAQGMVYDPATGAYLEAVESDGNNEIPGPCDDE